LLDIGRIWALRGPNIWGDCPVLELRLGLGGIAAGSPAETQARGQALWQRLCAWLPGLAGRGAPADASQGSGLAETFVLTALEIQTLAGSRVALGRVGAGEVAGACLVAVEFDEEAVGRACVETTRALVDAALAIADPDSPAELPFDLESEIARLWLTHYRHRQIKLVPRAIEFVPNVGMEAFRHEMIVNELHTLGTIGGLHFF